MKAALFLALLICLNAFISPAAGQPARSCAEAVAKCQLEGSNKPNIIPRCQAAGARCKKTGVFVGPVTGRSWRFRNP